MDELFKIRKSRTVFRSAITKYLNKLEDDFNNQLDSFNMLQGHLDYLKEMLAKIEDLDAKVQNIIKDEKEFEVEINSSFEYSEKIIMWNSRISAQLKALNYQQHRASVDCNVTRQTSTTSEQSNLENSSDTTNESNKNFNLSKSIKLPKLEIETYHGDPCLWLEFWNKFENSIDKNACLTKIDRFSYLKTLLKGDAANVVNGFALSDENYDQALILLKQRFGREDLIINAHMSKLLNLYPVKDSSNIVGLRRLYDTCIVQIRSLESLKITSGTYGHLLHPVLMKLIPEDLALDFHRKLLEKSEEGTFDVMNLLRFLKIEIECRESSKLLQSSRGERKFVTPNTHSLVKHRQIGGSDNQLAREKQRERSRLPNNRNTLEYVAPVVRKGCLYCKGDHESEHCESLSVEEKKEILRKQARCFLCLKSMHRIKQCKQKEMCEICNKKHNRSLCYKLPTKTNLINEENEIVSAVSHCNSNLVNSKEKINPHPNIFLQTCSAVVRNPIDEVEPVRILLDNGSMRTFITRDISEKLKLPVIRKETLTVYAFGAKNTCERKYNVVKVKIENRDEPSLNIEIEALETDEISATTLPTPNVNVIKANKQLKNLQLADCYKYRDDKIAILIGADNYYDIVTGRIKRLNNKLVATETLFGWCLQGLIDNSSEISCMKIIVEERVISNQLKMFWELENLGIEEEKDPINSEILKEFEEGISYQDNRYIVKFPWKPNVKQLLHDNLENATKRFMRLKSTFRNDPSFFAEYKAVLDDYLHEKIIEPVTDENNHKETEPLFYLPHRAVLRNDKATSKLRIVFDASSHSKDQLSLNDCLYTGLNLIPDLFLLLIKFRQNPIAFTADIKQAFLQIQIDDQDRDVTRFLWDDDPRGDDSNIKTYRMTRVLFGVRSSPFLLAATVKHHLKKYVDKFPVTCNLLNSSLYVDDFISGQKNVEQALKTSVESVSIFKDASMFLRKWQTNSIELREKWKEIGMDVEPITQTLIPLKVLGVAWDTEKDLFYFDSQNLINFLSKRVDTKRCLLQAAGRIFDPMGFLGPYVIRIKCLIQEIWCLGLDWDENLPKHLSETWHAWSEEITEFDNISIPRFYFRDAYSDINCIQLHFFSDASKKAYGCVAYIRVELINGRAISSFVASKSRVSPLKTLSLPRLELMGALLSARLNNKVSQCIDHSVSRYFWTDSSIAYFWIRGKPDRFKPFVKNRVLEIQKYSCPSEWYHCPGKENPADLISRGLTVSELKDNDLWWHGPYWLVQNRDKWPKTLQPIKELDIGKNEKTFELRKEAVVNTTAVDQFQIENSLIQKYSSFSKLVRISAWCLRFANNCKRKAEFRTKGYLNAFELKDATKVIVKVVQHSEFLTEIKCLRAKRPIPHNSKILSLNVYLDKEELLRVGGRLSYSKLPEFQKHQLLLPKTHHFTNLIIEHFHKNSLHSGTQTTLSLIRQLYWIPSGQDRVRRIIGRCMICFRTKNQTLTQIMGDLPRDRVIPSRPFEKIGLDFAGPIMTKPNLKRSRVTLKSYIAIFICFCTKAVHLEVVSDLTTEAFIASLRRFIARRSKPSSIWSDNATNFKGAKNVLNSLLKMCKSENIQNFSAEEGINWNFIPPASPHFGGLWEANIKSMKRILTKVTKNAILNFEELSTLVTQIEAVLNSRPLTSLSADPLDLQPLTPGHFLIGVPLLTIPEPNIAPDSVSFSSRWSLIQSLRDRFWSRWTKEYLNELQARGKWRQHRSNPQPGQLVLLKETCKIPLEWRLARIENVFPGQDGLVRVVDVRTSSGIARRAVTKITPLPFPENVGQPSNGGRDVRA